MCSKAKWTAGAADIVFRIFLMRFTSGGGISTIGYYSRTTDYCFPIVFVWGGQDRDGGGQSRNRGDPPTPLD